MKRKTFVLFASVVTIIFFATPVFGEEVIQVQPSSDGNVEASLFSAKVRKDVLTIKTKFKNVSDERASIRIDYRDVYYADVDKEKKYFALKDSEGQFIAGPKYDMKDGGRFWYKVPAGKTKILWIKFPAPAADTATIDIFLPTFLPFEEVAFQK